MTKKFLPAPSVAAIAALLALSLTGAAHADSSNKVKFRQTVSIKVGQAMVFHGLRGDCGKLPNQAQMKKSLSRYNAELKTGRLQYGKPGVRRSGQCNGNTPVMETLFVATTPGREKVKIYGDTVTFIVK
ncbi:hypothetical protein ROLI_036740 [Roseobacter fucihabitans]|uniref:Uncharacterized protein n=1 Tax=Roseobacter fucihabitans TaxID=1537242 RepID=A0ABZ2BYZ8_9RHOB|nr:hypothetical protein [Roseobacter litoralis]MBC6966327.1 hypothetical protein [Roseobacter litoralis]